MGGPRLLALCLTAASAVALTATGPAGADNAKLRPAKGSTTTIDFGASRDPKIATLSFVVAGTHAATNPVAVVASDLHASAGGTFLPASVVSAGAPTESEPGFVTESVTVTPGDADRGTYTGRLRFQAADIDPRAVRLTVVLGGREHSIWLALLALGAGIAVAAVAKWLVEVGVRLRDLTRRIATLRGQVAALGEWAPPNLVTDILRAQAEVEGGQPDAASALLDSIAGGLRDVTLKAIALGQAAKALGGALQSLGGIPDDQQAQITAVGKRIHDRLTDACEALWVDGAINTAAGDGDAVDAAETLVSLVQAYHGKDEWKSELAGLAASLDTPAGVASVKQRIDSIISPPIVPPGPPAPAPAPAPAVAPTTTAFRLNVSNLFDLFGSERGSLTLPTFPHPSLRTLASPARGLGRAVGLGTAGLKLLVIRYSGFLSGLLIAIVIAFIGLKTLYSDSDTYGSWRDWLNLAAWGFGAQLSGVTLTSLGGALKPTGLGS